MELGNVLSMGERLQRLLNNVEKEAKEIVTEAERKANEMISKAKEEAERRRRLAQMGTGIDELLHEAKEKASIEAEKTLESYREKVESLKELPAERMEDAVNRVLKEVLLE